MRLKILTLTAALVAVFSYAEAATINATSTLKAGGLNEYFWEQVNEDDNPAQVEVGCGEYLFEVTGTQSKTEFEPQFGTVTGVLVDIDSRLISSGGVRYTSTTGLESRILNLTEGFFDISFTSGGANQDLDFKLTPREPCER